MEDETKALAEMYLGAEIPQEFYEMEREAATRKLDRIISREGDTNGERRKPYYLAQLIAEHIRSELFTFQCMMDYETKKEAAHKSGQLPQPSSL